MILQLLAILIVSSASGRLLVNAQEKLNMGSMQPNVLQQVAILIVSSASGRLLVNAQEKLNMSSMQPNVAHWAGP